jgi:predicted thioesterase
LPALNKSLGYEARFADSQTVKGDDARIEARIMMLDARVSSFERRASIRASTTIDEILFSIRILRNEQWQKKWRQW